MMKQNQYMETGPHIFIVGLSRPADSIRALSVLQLSERCPCHLKYHDDTGQLNAAAIVRIASTCTQAGDPGFHQPETTW